MAKGVLKAFGLNNAGIQKAESPQACLEQKAAEEAAKKAAGRRQGWKLTHSPPASFNKVRIARRTGPFGFTLNFKQCSIYRNYVMDHDTIERKDGPYTEGQW